MRSRVAIPWLLLGVVVTVAAIPVFNDHDYKNTSTGINARMPTAARDLVPRDYVASQQTITDGATVTLAWRNGSTNTVTLGGNRTLAISGTPKNGESVILRFKQDGTGGRTITWPTSGVTINWPLGEEPLLTTEPGRSDAVIMTCFDETPGALVFDAYPMPFNLY